MLGTRTRRGGAHWDTYRVCTLGGRCLERGVSGWPELREIKERVRLALPLEWDRQGRRWIVVGVPRDPEAAAKTLAGVFGLAPDEARRFLSEAVREVVSRALTRSYIARGEEAERALREMVRESATLKKHRRYVARPAPVLVALGIRDGRLYEKLASSLLSIENSSVTLSAPVVVAGRYDRGTEPVETIYLLARVGDAAYTFPGVYARIYKPLHVVPGYRPPAPRDAGIALRDGFLEPLFKGARGPGIPVLALPGRGSAEYVAAAIAYTGARALVLVSGKRREWYVRLRLRELGVPGDAADIKTYASVGRGLVERSLDRYAGLVLLDADKASARRAVVALLGVSASRAVSIYLGARMDGNDRAINALVGSRDYASAPPEALEGLPETALAVRMVAPSDGGELKRVADEYFSKLSEATDAAWDIVGNPRAFPPLLPKPGLVMMANRRCIGERRPECERLRGLLREATRLRRRLMALINRDRTRLAAAADDAVALAKEGRRVLVAVPERLLREASRLLGERGAKPLVAKSAKRLLELEARGKAGGIAVAPMAVVLETETRWSDTVVAPLLPRYRGGGVVARLAMHAAYGAEKALVLLYELEIYADKRDEAAREGRPALPLTEEETFVARGVDDYIKLVTDVYGPDAGKKVYRKFLPRGAPVDEALP